ncbi:34569_t:CDS:2 [Gigaspora margarita]|uniref:34569_t:CDS:1 n=1 Tax=Gigaspora margarita TaxID=4874 RepID=A0ABN7VMQ2_GIGMA|nr:34569_t:CDS:2 [Gigaspora margarita]
MENYKLKVDCKKRLRVQIKDIKALVEDKKYRKRAGMSNTEERIYIPRIYRNQKLIDQGVTNKKERKILSNIMNEMDKRRDQKAEFWVKISKSSKENQKTFNQHVQLDKKEDLENVKADEIKFDIAHNN